MVFREASGKTIYYKKMWNNLPYTLYFKTLNFGNAFVNICHLYHISKKKQVKFTLWYNILWRSATLRQNCGFRLKASFYDRWSKNIWTRWSARSSNLKKIYLSRLATWIQGNRNFKTFRIRAFFYYMGMFFHIETLFSFLHVGTDYAWPDGFLDKYDWTPCCIYQWSSEYESTNRFPASHA